MFGPFKKEKPFQGLTGFGGGATGLSQHAGASGPTIGASGGTKVVTPTLVQHFFTSPGTFAITSGSVNVDYFVLDGGGSGGCVDAVSTAGHGGTGGGSGGGGHPPSNNSGRAGGSGIVLIAYPTS